MESGADQRAVFDQDDVLEFVAEWLGRRNLYHKAARYGLGAPGPRKIDAREFGFAWMDLDLVAKPGVAPSRYIDMAVDALDGLNFAPSVIVFTGGGIQALWHFRTPLLVGMSVGPGAVPAHIFIESLNRELARVFAGDPAPCHGGGGLRLPFTMNMNRSDVTPARGGPTSARVLRLEPEHVCEPWDLYQDLAGYGTTLSRTRDGHWARVSGVLSKTERAHMIEARAGAMANANGNTAKSADEWAAIQQALVLKGGRNVAAAKFAGWMIRHGLSEDDAVESLILRSQEAAKNVLAGGGDAHPLSRRELAMVVRSVAKTDAARTGS